MSQSVAVRDAISVLGVAARELDADGLRGPDAASLLEDVAHGERSLAVIKTLLAKRVDETGSFRSAGHQSAADWLAAKTGSTFTAAANTLAVGASLDDLPEVAAAFRDGELSEAQAKVVVDTARRVPEAAAEMITAAKRGTVKSLRDKATRIKCAAEPDDLAWAERLHQQRFHRRWTADDGAGCGEYRLAPEAAARLWASLDAKEEEIFQAARTRDAKDRESRMAYSADALVALTDGAPVKVARLQVIVDGELAELRGIGPIPMVTAGALVAGGSRVHEVRRDGAHLDGIDSDGRHVPAELRRWLDNRYPTCGVAGCDRDQRLEYDHVIPVVEGGTTIRDNLWRICPWHHDRKTYDKWKLTGTTHHWNLEPPAPPGHDPP